jgi:hypothetical protein
MTGPGPQPDGSLSEVLPAVAGVLGVRFDRDGHDGAGQPGAALALPPARAVVVMLVDGLGDELLAERGGHAPFLRSLRRLPASGALSVGFPATTVASLGTLGTGLPPGSHGLVALDVLDPSRGVLFNELAWDQAVDPRTWQPSSTVFEGVAAAGLGVVRIGPGHFDGSGLTQAVQRGGRFVAAATLEKRVGEGLAAIASGAASLVYLYWGALDKAGHEHGCDSWQWAAELENVDRMVLQLAEGLPPDVLLVVTADHGMVDVPFGSRLDLARDPELSGGVRHVGGEPRALHLYCEPGAVDDVHATWAQRLGGAMDVRTRDDAVAAGWFGPVQPHVLPRIGDVVTAAVQPIAVVDSRTARVESLRLLGLHGSRTRAERIVPLLVSPGIGRRAATHRE